MPSIPVETLLKLKAKMIKCAQVHRHPDPEDVAHTYIVRLLEGYHTKATVDQAFIDILRLTISRSDLPGYGARRTLNKVATYRQVEKSPYAYGHDLLDGLTQDELLDLKDVINDIKDSRTKEVFNYLLLGYTQKEIAGKFELSEARINQIILRQINVLHKKVKLRSS